MVKLDFLHDYKKKTSTTTYIQFIKLEVEVLILKLFDYFQTILIVFAGQFL